MWEWRKCSPSMEPEYKSQFLKFWFKKKMSLFLLPKEPTMDDLLLDTIKMKVFNIGSEMQYRNDLIELFEMFFKGGNDASNFNGYCCKNIE